MGTTISICMALTAGNPLSSEAALVKQLTGGDWEVGDIAGVDQVAHRVYYLSNEGDPRQQQIWTVGLNGEGKHQVSREGEWHEPVFSPNTNFFADVVSSVTIPPVVALVPSPDPAATRFGSRPPWMQRSPSPFP